MEWFATCLFAACFCGVVADRRVMSRVRVRPEGQAFDDTDGHSRELQQDEDVHNHSRHHGNSSEDAFHQNGKPMFWPLSEKPVLELGPTEFNWPWRWQELKINVPDWAKPPGPIELDVDAEESLEYLLEEILPRKDRLAAMKEHKLVKHFCYALIDFRVFLLATLGKEPRKALEKLFEQDFEQRDPPKYVKRKVLAIKNQYLGGDIAFNLFDRQQWAPFIDRVIADCQVNGTDNGLLKLAQSRGEIRPGHEKDWVFIQSQPNWMGDHWLFWDVTNDGDRTEWVLFRKTPLEMLKHRKEPLESFVYKEKKLIKSFAATMM